MFNIGFWQVVLIVVIALVVLGPERLPVVARSVGRWVGQARSYMRGLSAELDREMRLRELKEQLEQAKREVNRATGDVQSTLRDVTDGVETAAQGKDSERLPQAETLPPPSSASGEDDAERKP